MEKIAEGMPDLNKTVLVVEDEPLVRLIATDMFVDAGYRVFEACDAAEALAILESRCDVTGVFTDVEMPGAMNGLDLATRIGSCWPGIGVLITSGRYRPGDGIPKGAAFIAKPYHSGEVIPKLEAVMTATRVSGHIAPLQGRSAP